MNINNYYFPKELCFFIMQLAGEKTKSDIITLNKEFYELRQQFQSLRVSDKICDQDLSALIISYPNLKTLNCSWRLIRDQGLFHLSTLTNLKNVDFSYCRKITAQGCLRFKEQLPQCEIRLGASRI